MLVREAIHRRECRAPEAWEILRLVFLKKPDSKLEKELRGFCAIALLGVFSKWYTTDRSLHVGAEREMQDVRGSTCFENSETEFRYSKCIRQGGVEAPVLW